MSELKPINSTRLMLGAFEPMTRAMGPGKRACIWVRGCSIKCVGCGTPEFIPIGKPEHRVEVESVCERIRDARGEHVLDGVSFSGGEPFEQAEVLAKIARFARDLGLGTLSWSGYERSFLEGTQAPRGSGELLAALDVLIDGPFIRDKLESGGPLRGSGNQIVHLLTDRYNEKDFAEMPVEISMNRNGWRALVVGVMDYESFRNVLKIFGQI